MFERYTEPSRRVIFYSRFMASQAGSPEIGTEHLLLGLLRADMVLARRFLGPPWAAEEIWREIERKKPARATIPGGVDLPLSPETKRVLLLAAEEADRLSSKKFVREPSTLPQDVMEAQTRVRAIVSRMEQAIANHDFVTARSCSDEERIERDKLYLLYQKHELSGWIFE